MTLVLRQRTFVDAIVREPVQLAISQPHQVAISTISVSLMAIFFASSGAVPAWAAWAGAIGVEYAYLKGLSDAAYAQSRWGGRLVWGAFAIIVIAGISVLLRDAYHVAWMERPSDAGAVMLAVLHILPLAFIGLCSANLHMEAEAQRVDADRAALERTEALERDEAAYDRQRRQRRQAVEDEIAAERARQSLAIEAEKQKTLAKLEYRQVRVKLEAAEASVNPPVTASQSPAGQMSRVDRLDTLLTLIRQSGGVDGLDITRTAAHLGVSRQTIYNDIKAMREEGKLR